MPVAQLASYYLQVACFPVYHMNWRLHTSACRFRIVSKVPFPMIHLGFIAQGEYVCKVAGRLAQDWWHWIGITWKMLNHWSSRIHFVPARERENRVLQLAGAHFQPCQLIRWRPTRWERIYHTSFRGSGTACCPVSGTWELLFFFLFPGGWRQEGKVDSQFFVPLWGT